MGIARLSFCVQDEVEAPIGEVDEVVSFGPDNDTARIAAYWSSYGNVPPEERDDEPAELATLMWTELAIDLAEGSDDGSLASAFNEAPSARGCTGIATRRIAQSSAPEGCEASVDAGSIAAVLELSDSMRDASEEIVSRPGRGTGETPSPSAPPTTCGYG